MITIEQRRLQAAIGQLEHILSCQKINPVFDRQRQLLLSTFRIRMILAIIISELKRMHDFLQVRRDSGVSHSFMKTISACLDGNGYKIYKQQDSTDTAVDVDRSVNCRLVNDSIVLDILTNTTLFNGDDNKYGLLGSGSRKTVKQAVRLTIKQNILTYQFIARGNAELVSVNANGFIEDKSIYENTLEHIVRDSIIRERYNNSEFIAQMELGPEYEHTIYYDTNRNKKVSKKSKKLLRTSDVTATSQDSIPKVVANAELPNGIIQTKARAIYTYSQQALGSLDQISEFLTRDQKTEVAKDLASHRIPAIYRKIFNDVLQGLEVIHARGDVHGDIKIDNILLYRNDDESLSAKITDFDLATIAEDTAEVKFNMITGTDDYMSPQITKHKNKDQNNETASISLGALRCQQENIEIIRQNDAKHDIYSAGLMFFFVLINVIPDFNPKHGKAAIEILDLQCREHPMLKAMIATSMQQRPTARQAQQLLRLDYLLTTNDDLSYNASDLELLIEKQKDLAMRASCCGLFYYKDKYPTPHNSLKLVNNKILDLKAKQNLPTPSPRTAARHNQMVMV